jgi:hypothetical protein
MESTRPGTTSLLAALAAAIFTCTYTITLGRQTAAEGLEGLPGVTG